MFRIFVRKANNVCIYTFSLSLSISSGYTLPISQILFRTDRLLHLGINHIASIHVMRLSGMYLQLVIIPKREALRQDPTRISLQTVYKKINEQTFVYLRRLQKCN